MLDFLKRRWILIFGVYIILLLISNVVRWSQTEKPFPDDLKSVEISAVLNDIVLENSPIRFAYREFLPPSETNNLPVILIHGSPGDSGSLVDLAKFLSQERRVIVPDLPGFGASTSNIPEYGFRAHAFYLKEFTKKLNIEKFHLLGFSMGGGVALDFYEIAPERVASIEMISAIGVQEYELLGDYYLNHILHSLQLGAFWTLQNLVPHFGFLDNSFLGISYARNFYDSDQRPLREILQKIETPMLIVHGESDPLVPVKAAREHFRLVPQSEYHEIDDNHFMVFQRPEKIAPIVSDFLNRTENGKTKTKNKADADRIIRTAAPFQRETVMADGSTAFVFFLVLAIATLVSEDLTCFTAGALAGQGQISLTLAIAACFFGIFIGDILLFLVGRIFGRAAMTRAPLRWFISESSLNRGTKWLEGNGLNAVFLSRFTPGLRLPLYVAAGTLNTSFLKFAFFFAFAAAVWTPILVGAAFWFSNGVSGVPTFTYSFWIALFAIVISLFIIFNIAIRAMTWRGRRMLIGSFKRKTEWEFWSLKTFYFPVIIYIGFLTLKYRSISVFADANPAIEAGGFVGEPKEEIYKGLQSSPPAENHLLKYVFIPAEIENAEKLTIAETFIAENDLVFPIALKPNAGERGTDVFIVKNIIELESKIAAIKTDLILQEFAGGDEFGVFYFRYPKEKTGKIFAITEKNFPFVIGDGSATLEILILRDQRAVALANTYLERNVEHLAVVPALNEKVSIIDIGTHSKGAIFLDGGWTKTDALEKKIDKICRGYKGFYFGRFDLRTNSIEDFRRGENFKIIELNGVTSEATNIYDPKHSLFDAYKILFKQWHIAFEIGKQNRELGTKPTTVLQLIKLIYKSWFGEKSKIKNQKSKIA